jgi:hypothetical protein
VSGDNAGSKSVLGGGVGNCPLSLDRLCPTTKAEGLLLIVGEDNKLGEVLKR